MKYFKYICLVCYIFITIVIFVKAVEDGETSSQSSNQVTDIVVDTIDTITPGEESITDKFDIEDIRHFIRKAIGHFGVFLVIGVFSCFTYYLFIKRRLLSFIIIILVGLLTAGLSEIFQGIPEGRVPSFNDVLIDYVGYLIAVVIFSLIFYIPFYIKRKKVGSS